MQTCLCLYCTKAGVACRLNPVRGQVTLPDLALEILSELALVQGSQNQNAGFVSWFCMTVLLQSGADFRREATRTSNRYMSQLLQAWGNVYMQCPCLGQHKYGACKALGKLSLHWIGVSINCHEYDGLHTWLL